MGLNQRVILTIFLLALMINAVHSETVYPNLNISSLILFETIASNQDQTKSRFNEARSFSVLCHPRTNLYLKSELSPTLSTHLALAFASTCGYGRHNDENSFRKKTWKRPIDEIYIHYITEKHWSFKAGVMYIPFGTYQRNHIPATFTQLLSQSQSLAVQLGIDPPQGPFAFIYTMRNTHRPSSYINNVGWRLGLKHHQREHHWLISLDWILHMPTTVNYWLANQPQNFPFKKSTPGLSLLMKYKFKSWESCVTYTGAWRSIEIKAGQKPQKAQAVTLSLNHNHTLKQRSAKWNLSIHRSWQSLQIGASGLPRDRLQSGWIWEPWSNFWAGVHVIWDRDYSVPSGGTGLSSTTGLLTLRLHIE